MQKDMELLKRAESLKACLLRFYGWAEPSVTFGISQRLEDVKKLIGAGFDLAKRPTGGGIVVHLNDITYALAVPRGHFLCETKAENSYRIIHEKIAEAFELFGVKAWLFEERNKNQNRNYACFESPSRFDVITEGGTKLAGAAQKRNALGLLVQGSIKPAALPPNADIHAFIDTLAEKIKEAVCPS